jgi:membrane fusion protein, multidrug efflux system
MLDTRLLIVGGLALALSACNEPAKPPAAAQPPVVTVAKPVVKDVTEYDDYTGRFDATDVVEVRPRVTGFIETVAFRDGALVKKGDLLFTVDKRAYAQAVDQAGAAVISAQSRVNFAQGDLDRAQNLSKTGNISEQVLEQRRQASLTTKADLDAARAALETAKLNLEWTEVRAPIAGRIGRKLISEGNLVTANATLLTTIVSLDPIYFYFDIDERSFLAYQRVFKSRGGPAGAGNDVLIGVSDEKEPTRKAILDFLDNRIDAASGTIRGRAIVPNPDQLLTPGFFGTVRVPGSEKQRGVLVPDEAIATDQDRRLVWVIKDDNSAESREVRPGPRIDGYRLIRTGLNGDETIVVAGLQRVRSGAKVKPEVKELPLVRDADGRAPPRG